MPEISVIVPVYKVEPYLRKCVDSILAQTFTDIELILIDDGSPDNCGAICDEYAAKDNRVVVIHQQNAGVSAARNAGLDIARGSYIGFVDSDDWIEPEMYETMLRTAKESNADVVICGAKYTDVEGTSFVPTFLQERAYHTSEEMLKELFGMPCPFGGGVYNKLFLAKVIDKVRFDADISMGEDWIYLYNAFLHCKNGIQIPQSFYAIVERLGSATRDENAKNLYEIMLTGSLLLLLCREKTPQLEGLVIHKHLDDCLRYVPLMKAAGKKHHQPYRIAVLKIRWLMLKQIVRAWRLKLLPKAKLHGHIYGWIKL